MLADGAKTFYKKTTPNALTHSLPLISTCRFAHLCRSRPRGSIREQPSNLKSIERNNFQSAIGSKPANISAESDNSSEHLVSYFKPTSGRPRSGTADVVRACAPPHSLCGQRARAELRHGNGLIDD